MPKPKRKVIVEETIHYPEPTCQICEELTPEQAKQILGWTPESAEKPWATDDWMIRDRGGVKVQCVANPSNRPFYPKNCEDLVQEILRGRWRFNGEPIILSKTGKVLNGQHQLVALVLAAQDYEIDPDRYDQLSGPPTISKLLVMGVDDADDVVNTMDTCKPRSLSDVIYRSEYFTGYSKSDQQQLSRVCSYAVSSVWERLGDELAFAPRRTSTEILNFLESHPGILKAVKHVVEEEVEKSITKYTSLGQAAALLYLMGVSASDPALYDNHEDTLDLTLWDKAEEFFVCISSGAKCLNTMRRAFSDLHKRGGMTRKERCSLIAAAWLQWIEKGETGEISLSYELEGEGEDAVSVLTEEVSVGGIDLNS